MNQYIQLNRKFSPIIPKQNLDVSNLDYSLNTAYGEEKTWDDLLAEYRCVILAEAGAGKTKEFEECAKRIQAEGKYSFFIQHEKISFFKLLSPSVVVAKQSKSRLLATTR